MHAQGDYGCATARVRARAAPAPRPLRAHGPRRRCIPVLIHRCQLLQWPWHWGAWMRDATVFFELDDVVKKGCAAPRGRTATRVDALVPRTGSMSSRRCSPYLQRASITCSGRSRAMRTACTTSCRRCARARRAAGRTRVHFERRACAARPTPSTWRSTAHGRSRAARIPPMRRCACRDRCRRAGRRRQRADRRSIEWIDDSIAVSLVAGQQQALMDQRNVYLAGQQLSTGTCKNLIT